MRMALLCGASPRVVSRGPGVLLKPGLWEIEQTNQSDSLVSIYCEDTHLVGPFGKSALLELHDFTEVHVRFQKVGSEPYVSVFAVRQR